MTDDLKRCPFCGGEPKVFHHQNKWVGETWHIECLDDNCGCGTCHHESAEIAATVWNRRIEAQAAEIERLREALALFGGEAAIEAKQLFIRMTAAAKCSGKRKELAERHCEASRKAAIARAALGEGND